MLSQLIFLLRETYVSFTYVVSVMESSLFWLNRTFLASLINLRYKMLIAFAIEYRLLLLCRIFVA